MKHTPKLIESFVVHNPRRTDRNPTIARLQADLPGLVILPAIYPDTNEEPRAKGIRGCTLSHLEALSRAKSTCLVLEDDAVLIESERHFLGRRVDFPADCGAILVGAEVPFTTPYRDELNEVHLPYFGTHAVIYNTELLKSRGFFSKVFELLATRKLGSGGMCYEGVLYVALQMIGLKLCAYPRFAFNTVLSTSDRTGQLMAPRNCNRDNQLLADHYFDPIIRELRGKSVAVILSPGNHGDGLITDAINYLFSRQGINFQIVPFGRPAPTADVYAWSGGGNIAGRWDNYKYFQEVAKQAKRHKAKVIILPQSIEKDADWLKEADTVYLREQASFDLCTHPNKQLAPDLALNLPVLDFGEPTRQACTWLRDDLEGLFKDGPGFGDPIRGIRSPLEYLARASESCHNFTDRLHFAIASLLTGRKATLFPNDYHKNESMHKTWLHDLGVNFQQTP